MKFSTPLTSPLATPDAIGKKASGLAELARAGFRVPQATCLTTDAFRVWARDGITPDLHAEIVRAYRSLRPPLAVRSSSLGEDLAEASFAGQYVTTLGVRTEAEAIEAVQACWRSASSAASTAYRGARGIVDVAPMAVLLQELVPAEAAGVMFTMNPVSSRVDQVVVNSNFGLGDSVVSGVVEPDTFILDKVSGDLRESRLGTKLVITHEVGSAVREDELDAERRARFSLTAPQLRLLVAAAQTLEAHFDGPMDVEWAFVGDTLFMLQARPVTTGAPAYHAFLLDQWARDRKLADEPNNHWVRGSVLSGLRVSPLYYSEMSPFFADMFVKIAALHRAPAIRRKIFTYFNGHTYTDADFSSTADPPGHIKPESPFGPAWRSNLRIALRHPRSLAFWCNIDYYNRKWRQEWAPAREARRPDMTSASPQAIRDFIDFVEVQRRERSVVAGLAVGYAPNFVGLLAWLLKRWVPDAAEDAVGVLTSGIPDSLSHHENVELWQLSQRAAADPAVAAALRRRAFGDLAALEAGRAFLADADTFRRRHAHRGCSDRDILQPRWGDDRQLLLNQVAMVLNLGGGADPQAAHARAIDARIACEGIILEKLGRGPWAAARRWAFKRVLRSTQRYVIHRDNQRHTFEPYFFELRGAYQAIGDRLTSRGILPQRDDVFFLGKHEIYAYIDEGLSAEKLAERAAWRRAWWEKVTLREPPEHLRGYQEFDPGDQVPDGADLVGSPGAPGTARGRVRIIASLEELSRVERGDILVTYAIDPAWTPVFGTIAGVISVEGGMLAHAAVLGREYGLPVVLGVRDATRRLEEGELVRIDGTAGTVNRIVTEEPAESGGALAAAEGNQE